LGPDAWQVCSQAEEELDHGVLKAEVHNCHLFKEENEGDMYYPKGMSSLAWTGVPLVSHLMWENIHTLCVLSVVRAAQTHNVQ